MAGDWIKLAVDLPEKPEVWQIAGMVGIDADSVVGKLVKVWRWFDAHTEDGNAHSVTYALVDHIAGATGFGEAMALAGWLEQSGTILRIPNFSRHNGKTAKNRALTAKRVASHKSKSNADTSNEVTHCALATALPREEKRREEKAATVVALTVDLPDWIDREAWDGFAAMRKRERHPLTDRAAKLIVRELTKFRDEGIDPNASLDQSTRNGWRDVFRPKGAATKPAGNDLPDFMRGAI